MPVADEPNSVQRVSHRGFQITDSPAGGGYDSAYRDTAQLVRQQIGINLNSLGDGSLYMITASWKCNQAHRSVGWGTLDLWSKDLDAGSADPARVAARHDCAASGLAALIQQPSSPTVA